MRTKLSFSIMCILFAQIPLSAQVTVGSNEPAQTFSILEIISKNGNVGGLRLPHLTTTERTNLQVEFASNPTKSKGLLIYNITTNEIEYWDGNQWVTAKDGSGEAIEPWMVSGTTNQATQNTDNIYQMGQVTIGSGAIADPTAALNVEATDKGVLFPKIELTGITDQVTIPNPTVGLFVYNKGTHPNFTTEGYVYWTGTRWEQAKAVEPWMVAGTTNPAMSNEDDIYQMGNIGVGTKNPQAVFHIDAGKDNADNPTTAQLANDFIVKADGSVGIGTISPDPSAMIEVNAANKGFLGPRIALSSTTDIITIPNPTSGLLVYNTGTGGLDYAGYVYWNGSEWRSFTSGSIAPGIISGITCNAVQLTPSVYKAGDYYEGILIVPYVGGNGGVYPAQSIGPVNGLTVTIPSGNFNVGAGNLAFTVTGTPTVTTPDVTVFSINIGGQLCEATVGAGDGIAPGDLVFYKSPDIAASIAGSGDQYTGNQDIGWLNYYADDLPILGGKLRLDGYYYHAVAGSGTISFNPRLVNITDQNVKFWFSAMSTVESFNNANVVLPSGKYINLDNGVYNGYGINSRMSDPSITGSSAGMNAGTNNTEIITVDLSLDDKWYRIYYFPLVDNMEQTHVADMKRRVFLSIQRLY